MRTSRNPGAPSDPPLPVWGGGGQVLVDIDDRDALWDVLEAEDGVILPDIRIFRAPATGTAAMAFVEALHRRSLH